MVLWIDVDPTHRTHFYPSDPYGIALMETSSIVKTGLDDLSGEPVIADEQNRDCCDRDHHDHHQGEFSDQNYLLNASALFLMR